MDMWMQDPHIYEVLNSSAGVLEPEEGLSSSMKKGNKGGNSG